MAQSTILFVIESKQCLWSVYINSIIPLLPYIHWSRLSTVSVLYYYIYYYVCVCTITTV